MKTALISVVAIGAVAVLVMPKLVERLRGKPGAAAVAGSNTVEPQKKGGGNAPLRVDAITVIPAPLAETILSTGTLRAEEGVELQAETNGKVVSINFTEGAR